MRLPDAFISRIAYPLGGAEPEGSYRLIFGVDEVAKLGADQRSAAQVVIALERFSLNNRDEPFPRTRFRHGSVSRWTGSTTAAPGSVRGLKAMRHGLRIRPGLRGGGNGISPSSCMRNGATRRLISLSSPSGLSHPRLCQTIFEI